jgi:outer membrane protein TolC
VFVCLFVCFGFVFLFVLEKAGLNDFLSVLDAERSLLEADYQRSLARTQVLVESVALYKALAGGWPN